MSGVIQLQQVREALTRVTGAKLECPRRAAVALVLSPTSPPRVGLCILLVRRSDREGDPWSGHMALPGGHLHPSDADLLHTARRETLEEVGIDLTGAELLGRLDDVSPMRSAQIAVTPFVFFTPERQNATTSDEVAETVWINLDALAGQALRATRDVVVRGSTLRVPAYVIDERVVWGMTFRVVESFLAAVRGQV